MAEPIAFYFDFSSPYGYLAAQAVDAVGARQGREVDWRPFLLGVLFKSTGQQPLLSIPLKGDYARHDLARSARLMGVPFQVPSPFPFMSVAACRAYYWLSDRDKAQAKALAKAVFHAAFGEGRDMSGAEAVVGVAEGLGVPRADLTAALQDQAVKDRLRAEVEAGAAKGVFGSPYFIADGEPFWGHDRLGEVEQWLERGGW